MCMLCNFLGVSEHLGAAAAVWAMCALLSREQESGCKWMHLSMQACIWRPGCSPLQLVPYLEALKPCAICPHPHIESHKAQSSSMQTFRSSTQRALSLRVCVCALDPSGIMYGMEGMACVLRSMTDSHLRHPVTSCPSGSSAADEGASRAKPDGSIRLTLRPESPSFSACFHTCMLSRCRRMSDGGAKRSFIRATASLQKSITSTGSRSQDNKQISVGGAMQQNTRTRCFEGDWLPPIMSKM